MGKIKLAAVAMTMVMLLTIFSSCSSVKKESIVIKEDDTWYESTRFKLDRAIPKSAGFGTTVNECTGDDRIFSIYCYSTNAWASSKTIIDTFDFEGNLLSRNEVTCPDDYRVTSIFSVSAGPDGKTVNAVVYVNSETKKGHPAFVKIDAETGIASDLKDVFSGEAKKVKTANHYVGDISLIGDYSVAMLEGDPNSLKSDWKIVLFKNTEFVTSFDLSSINIRHFLEGFSIDEHSGTLFAVGYEKNEVVVVELDINNGKIKGKYSFNNLDQDEVNLAEYRATDRGELCKIDSLGNIMKIDVNTMTPKTMVDTNWYTPYFYPAVNRDYQVNSRILSCNEERTVIVDNEMIAYGSIDSVTTDYIRVLTKADKNPHAGKKIIELALPPASGVTNYLAKAIYEFNKTDNEYLIRVWDKYKTGFVLGRAFGDVDENEQQVYRMIQDLKGDDAPDLAIGIQKNYAMRDDVFMDLTGFLDPEVLDKQYSNIIEAGRIDGKLYFLPITLEIEGLVTNTDLLKDGAVGITFEEYDELVNGVMRGFSPYDYPESKVFNKRSFVLSCIDTKSAIEGETIDFGTDQFRAAVEYSKENFVYDDENSTPEEYFSDWNRFRGECYYVTIDDYLDYVYACYKPDGNYNIIGTPSVDASGPRFKAIETISVSVSTDVEEGCKKFLNYLFSGSAFIQDSCAFRQIVTNKDIMNKNIDSLTDINNNAYEEYMETIRNGSFIPAPGLEKATGNKASTDVMRKCFQNSLSTISTYYYEDYTIVQFTFEELAPYYAGDRTLDDTIKILNDRTSKYIKEM